MESSRCGYQLCGPSFVAPLPGGGLCVSDSYNHRVRILDERGFQMCELGDDLSAPLASPSGLAWHADGLLYVAERWAHRVRCFRVGEAPFGGGVATVCSLVATTGGREGSSTGRFSHPMGLALSGDGNRLFVADSYNHRVSVVSASTLAHVAAFGSDGARYGSVLWDPNSAGALRFPIGLTCFNGEVYVADSENHRIAVYSESGEYAFARSIGGPHGKRGKAPGSFNEPEGVAVAAGRLVVSEAAGCRLQVLTLTGSPLQICSGFFGRLAGVCCSASGDKLWVEDFYLDEVISLELAQPTKKPKAAFSASALSWSVAAEEELPVEIM